MPSVEQVYKQQMKQQRLNLNTPWENQNESSGTPSSR